MYTMIETEENPGIVPYLTRVIGLRPSKVKSLSTGFVCVRVILPQG